MLGESLIINQQSSVLSSSARMQRDHSSLLTPYLYLPSSIPLVDELIGGFKAKTITYLYGDRSCISHMPYDLCLQTYALFEGISVFVDGGTSMNPYILSHYAKHHDLSQWELLRHVQVSRAFTLHQFHYIVHEHLEPLINTHQPYTIIFHAFPLLYLDQDVSFHEAKTLFSSTCSTIKKLTRTYDLITLITNPFSHHRGGGESFHQMLFNCCDEPICIRQMKHCPRVELPRYQQAATMVQGTSGQLCLPDFGMVM